MTENKKESDTPTYMNEDAYVVSPTFTLWRCNKTTASEYTKTSLNVLFETSPYVVLKSSLVQDYQSVQVDDDYQMTHSQNESILQKIDIDVNRYSWIHYKSHVNGSFVHQLDGKTIQHFWVELCDDSFNTLKQSHFKDYTVVLKFETHDHKLEANERAINAYNKELFIRTFT